MSFHWAKDRRSQPEEAEVPPDRVLLSPASKRKPCKSKDFFGCCPSSPNSPLMTISLDGQSVKRLVDTGVDATVLTKTGTPLPTLED